MCLESSQIYAYYLLDGRSYHPGQVNISAFSIFSILIPVYRIFPDWHVTSGFIADHLNQALALDAKLSSHPIEVECPDANHVNQVLIQLDGSFGLMY